LHEKEKEQGKKGDETPSAQAENDSGTQGAFFFFEGSRELEARFFHL
jgi:hypothetical protein